MRHGPDSPRAQAASRGSRPTAAPPLLGATTTKRAARIEAGSTLTHRAQVCERALADDIDRRLARPGDDFDEIVAGVSADPQTDWTALKLATQKIVSAINAPRPEPTHVSVVVAGTAGGYRDVFACGLLSGVSEANTAAGGSFAWAGTGGHAASVALEEASQSHPQVTGEDLLRTIVCEAVAADPRYTGKPIYRIDLEDGATEPRIWLP